MPFIALPLLKLSISRRTVLWWHEAAQVQSADRLVPKAASSLNSLITEEVFLQYNSL